MNTPICDFVRAYAKGGAARLHVPGHKGVGALGCEAFDITEIAGADALYEASGVIAESERNAAGLFGTAATFYSCEGSSLCIRAMLYLAMIRRTPGARPVALAARNAHKAFVFAAALCGFDVEWLYPGAVPRTPTAAAPGAVPRTPTAAAPGAVPRTPIAAASLDPADRPSNGLPPADAGERGEDGAVPRTPTAAAPGAVPRTPTAAASLDPADRPSNGLPPADAGERGEDGAVRSVCACPVTPEALAAKLDGMADKPFCVYVTSPDYLGGVQDIRALAAVCQARGVPLLVDNAHGAYLKFLPESRHPIDLGADMCCDSAHKTLPVLTGGAYLHVADARFAADARDALALFGSTSPSYLILQSLDACNVRLAGDFPAELARCAERVAKLRGALRSRGFGVVSDEPLKLTLAGDGFAIAGMLRRGGVECEYADRDHAVLMFAPDNAPEDFARVESALDAPPEPKPVPELRFPRMRRAMGIREAVFSACEIVPTDEAVGRICAAPTVACPPAVPVAVSGEEISPMAAALFRRYGIERVKVIRR